MGDDRARLFVAVWPPPPVVAMMAALPRQVAPGVRWTAPDQWHVTLRFLGSSSLDAARDALRALCHPMVDVTVGPHVELLSPTVLVVPVDGLVSLAEAVAVTTATVGQQPESRPFRGHLTLARLRGGARPALEGCQVVGGWRVDRVALVRSDLHRDGARYTVLEEVALCPR